MKQRLIYVFALFFVCGCVKNALQINTCVCKADEAAKIFAVKLNENKRSIVLVVVKNGVGQIISAGTGFIYDKKGLVFTAKHVVEELGAVDVEVTFREGERLVVQKAFRYNSLNYDLSLLNVNYTFKSQLQIRTTNLQSGEELYSLGYPVASLPESGKKLPLIQSRGEFYMYVPIIIQTGFVLRTEILQTSTLFGSPGFSGAPVFDKNGEVVGIIKWNRPINPPNGSIFIWSTQAKYLSEVVKESGF